MAKIDYKSEVYVLQNWVDVFEVRVIRVYFVDGTVRYAVTVYDTSEGEAYDDVCTTNREFTSADEALAYAVKLLKEWQRR